MKQTCCLPENNDTQGIVKFSFSLKVNKRKRWITRTRNPPFFIVSVWKQCKLFYLISDRYSSYPSSFIFSLGMKRSEALLMQYRSPPFSFGPSVNTCPKWASWEDPVKRYVAELLEGKTGVRGKDFNMRWVAAMVAEVHRILQRGGIFMYPRDHRDLTKPGKLRLMYEANPMSMLMENAGAAATNGHQRILDIVPEKIHQRVAVFLGAADEVERVTSYHAE